MEINCEADGADQEEQLYGDSLRASPLKRINGRSYYEKEKEDKAGYEIKSKVPGKREGGCSETESIRKVATSII